MGNMPFASLVSMKKWPKWSWKRRPAPQVNLDGRVEALVQPAATEAVSDTDEPTKEDEPGVQGQGHVLPGILHVLP